VEVGARRQVLEGCPRAGGRCHEGCLGLLLRPAAAEAMEEENLVVDVASGHEQQDNILNVVRYDAILGFQARILWSY